jgi:N-acetylmuramoyl-L-alanine amidase
MALAAFGAPRAAQPAARPAATAAQVAALRSITRTPLPKGERLTLEFAAEVAYTADRVPNPDRVYFDFKQTTLATGVGSAAQALGAGPLVRSIRVARHTERVTRLVLQLEPRPSEPPTADTRRAGSGEIRYSVFSLYNPYRLIIDVEGETLLQPAAPAPAPTAVQDAAPRVSSPTAAAIDPVETPDTAAPLPPATSSAAPIRERTRPVPLTSPMPASATARGEYSLARQLGLGVARVVIDAGHGGHDPGAQSNGVSESELVLDVALRVEQLLAEQPGVEVVLTRRTDEFIPLEERTAIANREGADLFLSIHANASRQPAARGIETYFLNFATNPDAEAVAARENATSGQTMGHLPELVKTIALNNKVKESHELASIVQTSMMRRLRAQNKSLRDLGVKQAPFVVLIGAQMPSVLAEISFLTNKPEASLLRQSSYRQRIAQALCDAVLKYQGSLKKVTTVAVRDGKQ